MCTEWPDPASWCLGSLLQGCWIIPGVEGQRESRGRRRPLRLWVAGPAPPPHLGRPPSSAFLSPMWRSGTVCSCPGDGRSAGAVCRVPGPQGITVAISRLGQPAQPRHRALSSGSYLPGGLEADMLLLLRENICTANVCVVGMAMWGVQDLRDTEAPGSREAGPKSRRQGRWGLARPGRGGGCSTPDLQGLGAKGSPQPVGL